MFYRQPETQWMHLLSLKSAPISPCSCCHDRAFLCSSLLAQRQRYCCLLPFSLIPNCSWCQILLFFFRGSGSRFTPYLSIPSFTLLFHIKILQSRYKLLVITSAPAPFSPSPGYLRILLKGVISLSFLCSRLVFFLIWTCLELQVCLPNCFSTFVSLQLYPLPRPW